jgi:hypothetical protein
MHKRSREEKIDQGTSELVNVGAWYFKEVLASFIIVFSPLRDLISDVKESFSYCHFEGIG